MQQGSMRPVFGMLLIGGGIVLMVGLFAGKITFPLGQGTPNQNKPVPGATNSAPGTAAYPISFGTINANMRNH